MPLDRDRFSSHFPERLEIPAFVHVIAEEPDEPYAPPVLIIDGTGKTESQALQPLADRLERGDLNALRARISSNKVEVYPPPIPEHATLLNLAALGHMNERELINLVLTVPGLNAIYQIGYRDGRRTERTEQIRREEATGPTV